MSIVQPPSHRYAGLDFRKAFDAPAKQLVVLCIAIGCQSAMNAASVTCQLPLFTCYLSCEYNSLLCLSPVAQYTHLAQNVAQAPLSCSAGLSSQPESPKPLKLSAVEGIWRQPRLFCGQLSWGTLAAGVFASHRPNIFSGCYGRQTSPA